MIGRVASITVDPATNYYTLKIKTATNFFTIQSVDVIYNTRYNEQIELENRNQQQ
jgi:rod shape-determining protein MreC